MMNESRLVLKGVFSKVGISGVFNYHSFFTGIFFGLEPQKTL
jgi:hypothetical protein